MSEPFRTFIPLLCNLCPKTPTFSDVSHLLTHVSSKSHLSNRFKLQVRSQGEPDARAELQAFDSWYAEYGIEDLLSERLAVKEQRKTTRRTKGAAAANVKQEDPHAEASAANAYPPGLPLMHTWATASQTIPEVVSNSPTAHEAPDNDESLYATPTTRRQLPNFGAQPSPGFGGMVVFNAGPIKLEGFAPEPANEPESAAATLKGVYWPGMDLFDSATAEMKRKRNQKKDSSVLEQMKINSAGVEPTEWIFNAAGELERTRYIFDDSTESSPAKSEPEKFPSPKRRRSTRRPTAAASALGNVSTNAPRLTQSKGKGPASKPRPDNALTTVDPADTTYTGTLHPNPLSTANMFYTPNAEEEEEFRLTVGDMGKKKPLTVLRDAEVPSPGRTESPLEDHRFDLGGALPDIQSVRLSQNHFNPDPMAQSGQLYTLSPIRNQVGKAISSTDHVNRSVMQPMATQSMHHTLMTMQPIMMQPDFGGLRPAFHNETINPLLFNANTHALAYGGYHDFQPLHQGYATEFKSLASSDPFRGMGGQQSLPALTFPDLNGNGIGADDMSYHM